MSCMNNTKAAESYVLQHPSIKDSLKKGLINYSKLARQIIEDFGLKKMDFDAVLVALRRLEYKLQKKKSFERAIRNLLKESSLEIKNKIMVCIVQKGSHNIPELQKVIKKRIGELHIVEGMKVMTLITNQEFEGAVNSYLKNKIIKKSKDLVEIMLRSPETLEDIPGVVGYLYSLFGDNNINIVETMSCWTDTIFVIEEKELQRVIQLLKF